MTGITQKKYSSKTLASELQNLPEPRASLNSAYESSDIDENIILELPLNNLLCLLEAPKDGDEGRNACSGYQTCIDFIRTHYIVNEQEIDSKSTINLLSNKSQQITGIDFTDGLPNIDKNSKDYLSVARQLFIGMFRQAQFQANAKHLIVPQNSLLEELGINCNQLGYKRALEIQLAPIFDSKQMLLSHDKKRVSIKCEKQNSIDFLYSADIRINEISHNGFNKEGKEKVIKSRLYFTIELGKSGKIIYKDGRVILELPNDLNKELVSEIKEFYKYPLHVAARYGDINTIRRLLDSRVNVNETLKYQLDENVIQDTKRTALHEACFYGNTEVAELLIKHGAKVNIVSDIGSPLHCASHANSSVVNLLLKHGANPWIKNHFGATPLHVALENKNYIIASKLIDEVEEKKKKEYVNTHDNSGYTPLYLIARLSKIDENHKKLIELLIRNGADLYLKPRSESKDPFFNSESIIEIAKKSGNTEFIKLVKSLELIEADDLEKVNQLIEEGADPQFKNIDGKTALNYATNPEVIFALIKAVPKRERNSYINKKDKNGDTVLHYLAHRIPAEKEDEKYAKTVEILLENGANPYVKNKDQLDSLEVAINCKNCHFEECIWSFKKHQRQLNYIMVACAIAVGLTLAPLVTYFAGGASLTPSYFTAAVFIGAAVIGGLVGYGVAKLYEKVSEEKMKNPEVNTCTVLINVLVPECFKGQSIPEPT